MRFRHTLAEFILEEEKLVYNVRLTERRLAIINLKLLRLSENHK